LIILFLHDVMFRQTICQSFW